MNNEPAGDMPSVPLEAPAGGSPVDAVWQFRRLAVADAGVVWAAGCAGVYRITDEGMRLYSWVNSPLPRGRLSVFVDLQNRAWVWGPGALFRQASAWQSVLEGIEVEALSAAADGTVWAVFRDNERPGYFARPVAPQLGAEIALPEIAVLSIAAGENGALWLSTGLDIRRWSDGEWTTLTPNEPSATVLLPAPEQGGVLAAGNSTRVLRWTGTTIEQDLLAIPPGSKPIGFDGQGRLVLKSSTELQWLSNGALEGVSLDPNLLAALEVKLAPNGDVYFGNSTALDVYRDGRLGRLVTVRAAPPDSWFPWEGQPLEQVLSEPSSEVTAAELMAADASVIGRKLRVVGQAFGGFEYAGISVDGMAVPNTWAEAADEFWRFDSSAGLGLMQESTDPARAAELESWELYGYLEAPGCFGQLAAYDSKFWIAEAYPLSRSREEREALKAQLRAQLAQGSE